MERNNTVAVITTVALALIIIFIGVLMIKGKGVTVVTELLALSKKKKDGEEESRDMKALTRFIGYVLLPIGALTALTAVGGVYNIRLLTDGYAFILFAIVIAAVIYCNTGNRFKK